MHTITLEDEWISTARLFGDLESVIKEALKRYSIEQCQQRIRLSDGKIAEYHQKYGCEYRDFTQTIQTDARFLERVQTQNPVWEEDAMEWKYWTEEYQTWQNRLERISKR